MKGKYLITTDNWFYGPDGKKYRAAYGDVQVLGDDALGVKTNRNSTNWYVQVGNQDEHIVIAGCQIHYAIKCTDRPHDGEVPELQYSEKDTLNFKRPCEICFFD